MSPSLARPPVRVDAETVAPIAAVAAVAGADELGREVRQVGSFDLSVVFEVGIRRVLFSTNQRVPAGQVPAGDHRAALPLFFAARAAFNREEILTRWKQPHHRGQRDGERR